MSTCDMCGKEGRLVKAKVESTVLDLCEQCVRFGEVITRPDIISKNIPSPMQPRQRPKRKEVLLMVVPDYAEKIGQARKKMGLKQEEFAKRLNEKCSIMQKIESGQFKPSIDTARKFERQLKVPLVEQYDEKGEIPLGNAGQKKKDDGFMLGDFIKDKRKK